MELREELREVFAELRAKNMKPYAVVLGYEKMGRLEAEIGAKNLIIDQSAEEFIKGGAAAKYNGVDIYVNQREPEATCVITEKTFEKMLDEYLKKHEV